MKPNGLGQGIKDSVKTADTGRDADILELLAAGQQAQAFERLLTRYQVKVFRLCCGMLRDAALAADTAQETFVRIWKALPRYNGSASLSTWIYAISRNRCLTEIARQRERLVRSTPDAHTELDNVADENTQAEAAAEAHALRRLVAALPARQQQVLTLFYFEDQSHEQVAEALHMPIGTVKTLLHRAKQQLCAEAGQ
jgi:RNA polymerase sigma-70 factor, ECF subfamily